MQFSGVVRCAWQEHACMYVASAILAHLVRVNFAESSVSIYALKGYIYTSSVSILLSLVLLVLLVLESLMQNE